MLGLPIDHVLWSSPWEYETCNYWWLENQSGIYHKKSWLRRWLPLRFSKKHSVLPTAVLNNPLPLYQTTDCYNLGTFLKASNFRGRSLVLLQKFLSDFFPLFDVHLVSTAFQKYSTRINNTKFKWLLLRFHYLRTLGSWLNLLFYVTRIRKRKLLYFLFSDRTRLLAIQAASVP